MTPVCPNKETIGEGGCDGSENIPWMVLESGWYMFSFIICLPVVLIGIDAVVLWCNYRFQIHKKLFRCMHPAQRWCQTLPLQRNDVCCIIVCLCLCLWIIVSLFSRHGFMLACAAWLLMCVLSVYHLLLEKGVGRSPKEEFQQLEDVMFEYKLKGHVVDVEKRKTLNPNGDDLLVENNGVPKWCDQEKDEAWYRGGTLSCCILFAKAVLNVWSWTSLYRKHKHDIWGSSTDGSYVGIVWVLSVESLYGSILWVRFFWNAWLLYRRRSTLGESAFRAVQLSGLLKSLGRFSALNLLESMRIDEFTRNMKWRERFMSCLCGVLGFIAFRCKLREVAMLFGPDRYLFLDFKAFKINDRTSWGHAMFSEDCWNWADWLTVLALTNNVLSIVDVKQKMISQAIERKQYRKHKWWKAVAEYLLKKDEQLGHDELQNVSIVTAVGVVRRLVSIQPHDAERLLEDLIIEESRRSLPNDYQIQDIPETVWGDSRIGNCTNVVGAVRLEIFLRYAEKRGLGLKDEESPVDKERQLLFGRVAEVREAQQKNKRIAELQNKLFEAKTLTPAEVDRTSIFHSPLMLSYSG